MFDAKGLEELVGKTVKKVFMNSEFLSFVTNDGKFSFGVEGDCCSHSYFHDFIGLDKLLKNGEVVSVAEVELDDNDPRCKREGHEDCLRCYGYEIVTKNPEFGEQTTVFSFRNDSNGYYGGWMKDVSQIPKDVPQLTEDSTEV